VAVFFEDVAFRLEPEPQTAPDLFGLRNAIAPFHFLKESLKIAADRKREGLFGGTHAYGYNP
jgi:hypothetical protein